MYFLKEGVPTSGLMWAGDILNADGHLLSMFGPESKDPLNSKRLDCGAMNKKISTPPWTLRVMNRLRAFGKPAVTSAIVHDARGICVDSFFANGSIMRTEIEWSEIVRAVAFKRDCFAVDLICIVFQSDEAVAEVNEQMAGYSELVTSLPRHLPGCLPQDDWFPQVVFPAFETNPIYIFRSASSAPS